MLQSKNSDVEATELDIMRKHEKHKHSLFMFVGAGDGLAVSRINDALARNSRKYIRTAPAIIPVQGEHPHGTCHVLHMGWRPYASLVVDILVAIGHNECRSEFTVPKFNDYNRAICVLMEGIAKYFMLLRDSREGMPPLHNAQQLARACE
eukprot:4887757-Pleurochrysis_carterae.AAC.1